MPTCLNTALVVVTSSPRSEEHTSEFQSRSDLVCRLLLEKKKKIHPPRWHQDHCPPAHNTYALPQCREHHALGGRCPPGNTAGVSLPDRELQHRMITLERH